MRKHLEEETGLHLEMMKKAFDSQIELLRDQFDSQLKVPKQQRNNTPLSLFLC